MWLGLWFLVESAVGPSRDTFFSDKICDEYFDAPLRLTKYTGRKGFNQVLLALRYTDKSPPSYKDSFLRLDKY